MKNLKKTILIKVTSSAGVSMSNNAEFHTLIYFCKWLKKDYKIIVSGIECDSLLTKELIKLDVLVRTPFVKYLYLRNFKGFLHIPISIVNTLVDAFISKPDLLICLGGVFYNGLGILISGKILGIKTLVRSAEDHVGVISYEKYLSFKYFYAKLKAFLSKIVIKNSSYFLTVGEWSLSYFKNIYKLSGEKIFMLPGPLDNSIIYKEVFSKTKNELKNYLLSNYKIPKNKKLILFVGTHASKGVNNLLELAEKIKEKNLLVEIIWISDSKKIMERVKTLYLNDYIKIIKPLNRDKLIELLKGVDYLFWSTLLGVGYGQIMLESILCETEVICYQAIGDAKHIVKDKSYQNTNQILDRIKGIIPPKKIAIPEFMDEKILSVKHLNLFHKILRG